MDQDKSAVFEEHMDKINRYLTQGTDHAVLWEAESSQICSRCHCLRKLHSLRWMVILLFFSFTFESNFSPTLPRGVIRCWPLPSLLILIQISLFKVGEKDLLSSQPHSCEVVPRKYYQTGQPEALCCDLGLASWPKGRAGGRWLGDSAVLSVLKHRVL